MSVATNSCQLLGKGTFPPPPLLFFAFNWLPELLPLPSGCSLLNKLLGFSAGSLAGNFSCGPGSD